MKSPVALLCIFLVSGLLFSLGVIYVYTGSVSEETGLKDLTKITDNLEGNSINALPSSNSTMLARQKSHSDRGRNSSPDRDLSDIEIQKILNASLFLKNNPALILGRIL